MTNHSARVTVIGSGISGLAVAFELLKRGHSCTLVGPESFEGTASTAAGAMVDTFGEIAEMKHELETHQLHARLWAQRHYPEWLEGIEKHANQSVFHTMGMFIIGNSGGDHDIAKLALMRRQMRDFQEPYEDVIPATIPGLKSNVQFQAFDAFFMPKALTVDTSQLIPALQKAVANDSRCNWIRECSTTLQQKGRSWQVTTETGGTITSEEVIVAAGAFSQAVIGKELWQQARLPALYFGRGASCIVKPHKPLPHAIRTPNRALACGIHLVPRANDMLYLGATNLFGTNYENASKGPTVGELHTLLGVITNQLNTPLRNVSIKQSNWGLRPITAYDHPIAGRTALEGLHILTGAHRTGVHLAPYLSKTVVGELLGESTVEPNHFSPEALEHLVPKEKNFTLGIRSLLATALYPDGSMPYNRGREVEVFIEELFRMAVTDEGDTNLQSRLKTLIDDIHLDEQRMIRVFHEILQQRIPEEGPYVM